MFYKGRTTLVIINKMGIWFDLHPHYDINKRKSSSCFFCKIGAILKIIIIIFLHIVSFIGRTETQYGTSKIMTFLNIIQVFTITPITIAVLTCISFGDMKMWDKCLKLSASRILRLEVLWQFWLIFIFIQLYPTALIIGNLILYTNTFGFRVYRYFIIQDIIDYHGYMLFVYYAFLIYCVKKELQKISHKLIDIFKQEKKKKEHVHYSTTENIKLLRNRYVKVSETVKAINQLFGWQMLFLTGYSSTLILSLIYLSVWILDSGPLSRSNIYGPLIMNILLAFTVVVKYL